MTEAGLEQGHGFGLDEVPDPSDVCSTTLPFKIVLIFVLTFFK